MPEKKPLVAVVMGSDSDWSVMSAASATLTEFGVAHEVEVVSAHRTPEKMISFGKEAHARGIKVIIAGAGGAAHLPVPVPLAKLDGLDSLLSIVQMPAGVPVATVSIGGATNAALIAAKILALSDDELMAKVVDYAAGLAATVEKKNEALKSQL
jgi:5-(carboxyamino)imidazole ribonucleotide mutase